MEKIWIKNYPDGVENDVNIDNYKSFVDLFEEGFSKYSDKIAFENMGKSISYKELDDLSKRFSNFLLKELKLNKGDRLAIQSPNVLQYPVALIGALRSGIIVVNTNPLYTPDEMRHQFKDSGCKAILILSNFAFNLEKVISDTKIKHVIVSNMGDMLGTLKGSIVNFVVKYVKKMVPSFSLPNHHTFKDALSVGGKYEYDQVDISPDDIAFLQYTGGTTGISMGAARKKQMRDTANLSTEKNKQGVSLAMKRAYEDTGKYKTTLLAALKSGDRDRIRRAFAKVDISVPDFLAVHRQFRGGN